MSRVLQYITDKLKDRQEVGLKKYGVSIDDCDPPTGSFRMEVIEEVLDALQYITRLVMQHDDAMKEIKNMSEESIYCSDSHCCPCVEQYQFLIQRIQKRIDEINSLDTESS